MPATTTTITCASAADGVRLSQLLASPALWGGQMPLIEGNGASVTLSWPYTVQANQVQTALTTAKPGIGASVVHTIGPGASSAGGKPTISVLHT